MTRTHIEALNDEILELTNEVARLTGIIQAAGLDHDRTTTEPTATPDGRLFLPGTGWIGGQAANPDAPPA